jgi:hypothetical protein
MTDHQDSDHAASEDAGTDNDRGSGDPGTDRSHLQEVPPTQVDERAVSERLGEPETDAETSIDDTASPDTTDEQGRPVENPSG